MRFTRKAVAATLATALVSTSITPAFAGGYGSFGIGSGWGNSWGSVGVSMNVDMYMNTALTSSRTN